MPMLVHAHTALCSAEYSLRYYGTTIQIFLPVMVTVFTRDLRYVGVILAHYSC